MKNHYQYIVTGAAGLIGGAIVRELNRRGISDILTVDHLSTSEKWKNLRESQFADYMEREEFRKAVKDDAVSADVMIHMGACSSTTETDASYLIDNNYNYTKEMAEFCVKNGIQFLYASSAATYGGGECGYKDDESAIEELRPLNMYGYSKQLFDLWAKRNGYLSRITGVKFTNVFGPYEKHKNNMRSMVIRSFEQIRETGKVCLFKSYKPEYSDGGQQRDFIYVEDAANMVLGLLEKKAVGIYNIGSGRAETWNALATAVFKAMGKPVQIEYIEMPESLRPKYQYYTCADMTKFDAVGTGIKARSLEQAAADYVAVLNAGLEKYGDLQ